jgi:uncharacterized membrane protein
MALLKRASLWLMAAFYLSAGIRHFTHPDFYLQIMPPYLPWHEELVWLSGCVEVALGVALVIPATTRVAAWGVIALLLAVYPANVHMWWSQVAVDGEAWPPWAHWIRLPFQFVLIGWAWWYTRPERSGAS